MPWTYISEVDAFSIYHQVREEQQDDATTTQEGPFLTSLGHAVAGSIGTAISNLAVYPLDLVVTRLQVQQRTPAARRWTEQQEKKVAGASDADANDADSGRGGTGAGPKDIAVDGSPHYASLPSAVRHIYRTEGGVPAFYAGITQDTIKSMADSFLFFLFYNLLLRLRRRVVSGAGGGGVGVVVSGKGTSSSSSKANTTRIATLLSRILSSVGIGMLAGATTKGLTSPLQQVITLKKTSASSCSSSSSSPSRNSSFCPSSAGIQNQSTTTILKHIYRTRGLRGFWAGYSASLVLTLNPSLTMAFHGFLEKIIRGSRGGGGGGSGGLGGLGKGGSNGRRTSEALLTFVLAATSKAAASCVMYPASVAKTRAQVDLSSPPAYEPGTVAAPLPSSSSSSTTKSNQSPNQATPARSDSSSNKNNSSVLLNIPQIAHEEGIGALYAGLGGEMVKGFLAHGLTMVVKEGVQGRLVELWGLLLGFLRQGRRG